MRGRHPYSSGFFLGKVTVAFAQVDGSVRVWRESFCYQTSALVILSFRTCWLYSAVFGELPSQKPLPFASDRVHACRNQAPACLEMDPHLLALMQMLLCRLIDPKDLWVPHCDRALLLPQKTESLLRKMWGAR